MQSGDRLGDFILRDPLGQGAQGRVWRADHARSGAVAALKWIPNRSEEPYRGVAELNALARLNHPHVARLFDFGLAPGGLWLALEHCPFTYRQVSKTTRDWSTARAMLFSLLDGLAHAHAHGVIHRDLKPSNVLIAGPKAGPEGIRLVDFGIAMLDGATDDRPRGTPVYMALEQFSRDPSRLGPWTDLYSLGGMAWALVTGRRPFSANTHLAKLIRQKSILQLAEFEPRFDVPEGLEEVLRRSMYPEIGSRYLKAADFKRALRDLDRPTVVGRAVAREAEALPTVPVTSATTGNLAVPPLDPVVPTKRPRRWWPVRPPLEDDPLALLREPHLDAAGAKLALWSSIRPGSRIALTGPGAEALADWVVPRLREVTGLFVLRVRGNPVDGPGAALFRLLDDLLNISAAEERIEAARTGLARLRAGFGTAEVALRALLDPSGTSVIQHGAMAAILDAVSRVRGIILVASQLDHDRDLLALVQRVARRLPHASIVITGAAPPPFKTLHVAKTPPAIEVSPALDRLTPSERAALQIAAVLGSVERKVWRHLCPQNLTTLIALEEELVRARVARRRQGGWVFRDPAIRQQLIDELAAEERLASTAALAARALEQEGADVVRVGRLWCLAGEPATAIRSWLEHADDIEDGHGRRAAAGLWREALQQAVSLPLSEDLHGALHTRELTVMSLLRDKRKHARRVAQATLDDFVARGWTESAARLCWVLAVVTDDQPASVPLGHIARGLELCNNEGHTAGRLWSMRFRISHEHGTGEHQQDMRNAIDILESIPVPRAQVLRHRLAGLLAQFSGDLPGAQLHYAEQVRLARTSRPSALPEAMVQQAVVLCLQGKQDAAVPLLEEALELAEFAESPHQAAYAASNLMVIAMLNEDWRRTARMAHRSVGGDCGRHLELASSLALAACAYALEDEAADAAWAAAKARLNEPHAPDPDFVVMLEKLHKLTGRADVAAAMALERSGLPPAHRGPDW